MLRRKLRGRGRENRDTKGILRKDEGCSRSVSEGEG
jgi:hypothetical protein